MKVLGFIGKGLIGLILVLIAGGLILPSEFMVQRSTVIHASPAQIHPYLDDLTRWPVWSPWERLDPSIKTTIGRISSGVGASQSWTSDEGPGSLTLTASDPQSGIRMDLYFNGDSAPAKAGLTLADIGPSEGSGTRVVWFMKGDMDIPVIGPYFAMMMDGMVAEPFELGLSLLKQVAEGSPQ